MVEAEDFLDEMIAEGAANDPAFPGLVEAELRKRQLLRALAARRRQRGMTQAAVAHIMGTSQAAVARLERGEVDPKLSTLERFAAAVGQRLAWQVAEDEAAMSQPVR